MSILLHSNAKNAIISTYTQEPSRVLSTLRGDGRSLLWRCDVSSIPRTSGIYKITCLPTKKIYIGSGKNLEQRWLLHARELRGNRHVNARLQHAWNKYGESSFVFEVIEQILEPFLLEREQYWIDQLHATNKKHGFNISLKAGAPMSGRKHTPEALAKITRSSTGRVQSAETRQKKSDALRGRQVHPVTQAMRERSAEVCRLRTGMHHSPEAVEKMRVSSYQAREFIVTLPSGEEVLIKNLAAFCREYGLTEACMRDVAKGRSLQHRGYKCRYP